MSKINDDTTGNLLDYEYFSNLYKLIATDLSKQTELETPDLKQKINFIGKLEEDKATMFFFSLKNQKKQLLFFHTILKISYKMKTQKLCLMILKNLNLLQKIGMSDCKR